jgi:diamine N-acetyltransferase
MTHESSTPNKEKHVPSINFAGETIALGPLRRELISVYMDCNNDFQTTRTLAISRPVTEEELIAAIDRFAKMESCVFFTIYEKASMKPIGITFLTEIDYKHRTAEFNIVISDSSSHGKGYGTETTKLMMDYAFSVVGVHNLQLRVYEFNKAAIRVYEKAGFRTYGTRRESHFIGGRMWDTMYMECLAADFTSRTPEWDFSS